MALIKCPECEKEISDKAESCPNCGCPMQSSTAQSVISSVAQENNNENSVKQYEQKKVISIKYIIIILFIILVVFFLFFKLSHKKPSNVSEKMYSYGESAIKVIDDYLDNEINYDTAHDKLDGLQSSSKWYLDSDESIKKEYNSDFFVCTEIGLLDSALFLEHSGASTYSELLESRNNLAEELNISKRKE